MKRALTREVESGHRDLEAMVHSLESLERAVAAYKQREVRPPSVSVRVHLQHFCQLGVVSVENESRNRVHDAELRRDQAAAREQAAKAEIERLRAKYTLPFSTWSAFSSVFSGCASTKRQHDV